MLTGNTQTVYINVHHLTRVEGHGNIVVNIKSGVLEECDLQIIEAPRFFEAMLRGKPYMQASRLASRICGICAVAHVTASLRAIEQALDVEPSEQTVLLRRLNLLGEMLDSHILHIYMLVAPDLLGVGSVVPLAKSAPEVVLRALRMKKVAGDLCAAIGGRHTHPITMAVGGFTNIPLIEELSKVYERLEAMRVDLDATVEFFQSLSLPTFERDTEYLALRKEGEYCLIDGTITSGDGGSWPIEEYLQVTNEHMVDHSTAKHACNQRQSYMVGALARFNVNYDKLHPKAQAAATALGMSPICVNPHMNTLAQVIESVHCTEEAIHILQTLIEEGVDTENPIPALKYSGEGIGACEAPRGTLYHHYEIRNGSISSANCVTPTAQNLANIEADMRKLVELSLGRTPDEITNALEILVRAYDPCISCSTHMLDVKFV